MQMSITRQGLYICCAMLLCVELFPTVAISERKAREPIIFVDESDYLKLEALHDIKLPLDGRKVCARFSTSGVIYRALERDEEFPKGTIVVVGRVLQEQVYFEAQSFHSAALLDGATRLLRRSQVIAARGERGFNGGVLKAEPTNLLSDRLSCERVLNSMEKQSEASLRSALRSPVGDAAGEEKNASGSDSSTVALTKVMLLPSGTKALLVFQQSLELLLK